MNWYKLSTIMDGNSRGMNYLTMNHDADKPITLWWFDRNQIFTKISTPKKPTGNNAKYRTMHQDLREMPSDCLFMGRFDQNTRICTAYNAMATPYLNMYTEGLYQELYHKFGADIKIITFFEHSAL